MLPSETPTVSVLIPALNEKDHIESVVKVFQQSAYSNIIEIFVADGGSTDGTQDIVRELSKSDPRIKLIDNPDRYQSAALNLMIKQAKGEVLLRADAHCEYDTHYVEACVAALNQSGSMSVGGAQRFVAKNAAQAGISLIVRTICGSGNALYRDEHYSGYADTVFLGCFRREVFEKIGGYSTDFRQNEDTELNIRILRNWPKGVYVSSDIKVWYYPRTSQKRLWQQYYLYGKSRVKTRALHPDMVGLRASIPFLSLLIMLLVLVAELVLNGTAWAFSGFVSALVMLFVVSGVGITFSTRKQFESEIWRSKTPPPSILSRIWFTISSGIILNLAHACGYAVQFLFKKSN